MSQITMSGCDAVSAQLAECYMTVQGKRYNFMQMIAFEARMTKHKTAVPVLGKSGMDAKSGGWSGTFKGKAHYNQSVLRKLLLDYKDTGCEIYFEIQVTNNDPAAAAGMQTVVLLDCSLDGGVLAKFDATGKYLEEDISGTFDDFRIPQSFSALNGMTV